MEILLLAGLFAAGMFAVRAGRAVAPDAGLPPPASLDEPASEDLLQQGIQFLTATFGQDMERLQLARDGINEWAIVGVEVVSAMPDSLFAVRDNLGVYAEVIRAIGDPRATFPQKGGFVLKSPKIAAEETWAAGGSTFLGMRVKRVRAAIVTNREQARSESPHLFIKAPALPELGPSVAPSEFVL